MAERNPGQGAAYGGGVGWMVPVKPPTAPSATASSSWRGGRCGPWWSARRPGSAMIGAKWPARVQDSPGPPGIRHLFQALRTEIPPPAKSTLCNLSSSYLPGYRHSSPYLQSSWLHTQGLLIVTLSVAKGLSCVGEILRSGENDRSGNDRGCEKRSDSCKGTGVQSPRVWPR